MFVVSARVNWISLELTNWMELDLIAFNCTCVFGWKPIPLMLTTVPAGNTPPPGTTSRIEIVPPTVTVAGGAGLTVVTAPDGLTVYVDEGSSWNCVELPGVASGRICNAIVMMG